MAPIHYRWGPFLLPAEVLPDRRYLASSALTSLDAFRDVAAGISHAQSNVVVDYERAFSTARPHECDDSVRGVVQTIHDVGLVFLANEELNGHDFCYVFSVLRW